MLGAGQCGAGSSGVCACRHRVLILARICAMTRRVLVVKRTVVHSIKPDKSDQPRSDLLLHLPSLSSSRAQAGGLRSIHFHWFTVQIYNHTLNIQTGKGAVLRALRRSNFTSLWSSCNALAWRVTCPCLICDFSPLVWACYQLDPARPSVLGVPRHRCSRASPGARWPWASHRQQVTIWWLLRARHLPGHPAAGGDAVWKGSCRTRWWHLAPTVHQDGRKTLAGLADFLLLASTDGPTSP